MAIHQNHSFLSLEDILHCQEMDRHWEEDDEEDQRATTTTNSESNPSLLIPLEDQDLFCQDAELLSLLSKEERIPPHLNLSNINGDAGSARAEAVDWILSATARYGFTVVTPVLAINYLDRLLSGFQFQREKPWMIQLAAVSCLSLAAKVEETQVPLLLDLQGEESKYLFEAKTIQRMELLVLSTLKWKMHIVTPISFLDHVTRRLGLKTHIHQEFLRRCHHLLLSLAADSRSAAYLPSVLAAAAMLHVMNEIEPCDCVERQNLLLGMLRIRKEKVEDCCELVVELSSTNNSRKRKNQQILITGCPNGVIDALFASDDCSNDSSAEPLIKKGKRAQEEPMRVPPFVDFIGSPR